MLYQRCRTGTAHRPNGNLLHSVEPAVVPDFHSDVNERDEESSQSINHAGLEGGEAEKGALKERGEKKFSKMSNLRSLFEILQ